MLDVCERAFAGARCKALRLIVCVVVAVGVGHTARAFAIVLPAPYNTCSVGGDNVTPNCSVPAADGVTCPVNNASTKQCLLWKPDVTTQSRTYGTVPFAAGDLVRLYGNGCAQGGGSGSTWHRYVNPHDNLHFGSASISGGALPMTRFSSLGDARDIQVATNQLLTLYFNDDPGSFGDNGYYSWDSGDA